MKINYTDLNKINLKEIDYNNTFVLMANSPLEVHGKHLPISADLIQAEYLSQKIIEVGEEILKDSLWIIYPTLPIGIDPIPHQGSINYTPELLINLMKETLFQLKKTGFRNIILSNFHASPRHLVVHDIVCDYFNSIGGKAFSPFGILFSEFIKKDYNDYLKNVLEENNSQLRTPIERDIHGGAIETSLVMASGGEVINYKDLKPLDFENNVKVDEIINLLNIKTLEELNLFVKSVNHFRKYEYSGDPAKANKKVGDIIFNDIKEKIKVLLEEFINSNRIKRNQLKSPLWKYKNLINDKIFNKVFSELIK